MVQSSPAMAVPKKDSFRLLSDYKAVNEQVKSPGVMPNREAVLFALEPFPEFCLPYAPYLGISVFPGNAVIHTNSLKPGFGAT